MYDGIMAETINFRGHDGEEIAGYLARPLGPGPYPGVVVIHHMPGYDEGTKEIARTFATHGFNALCPNLHYRVLPGGDPEEAARLQREGGGVPDEQCIGDVRGASERLREMVNSNGKLGVIGYCSGGRQTYLVACSLPFDAAVDCYGGNVATLPEERTPTSPMPVVDLTPGLSCPLLGLFGVEDKNPSPEQVARIEDALKQNNKEYEFHIFDDAGHAFFTVDRPNFRVEASIEGWKRIWDFFGRHLS